MLEPVSKIGLVTRARLYSLLRNQAVTRLCNKGTASQAAEKPLIPVSFYSRDELFRRFGCFRRDFLSSFYA
jgi:hypothetical protein